MRICLFAALAALPLLAISACQSDKGPAQTAGEKLDNAGTKVRDTLDPPRGPAENLGRKLDRATGQ